MTHSSVSKSNEYYFADKTEVLSTFGAVKSCPESDGCADSSGICFLTASIPAKIPDVFFGTEHNPTAFCNARHKTPASAECHTDAYRSPEVASDGLYDTMQFPVEVEFPSGRIRHTRRLGRWTQTCLRICESVFFRAKTRIVAFLPRLGSPQPNLVFVQNPAKCFDADREDNLFPYKILPQLFQ